MECGYFSDEARLAGTPPDLNKRSTQTTRFYFASFVHFTDAVVEIWKQDGRHISSARMAEAIAAWAAKHIPVARAALNVASSPGDRATS